MKLPRFRVIPKREGKFEFYATHRSFEKLGPANQFTSQRNPGISPACYQFPDGTTVCGDCRDFGDGSRLCF